ncbi:MAG: tRNA pseudouridine(13) synthase TruD [Candidatus Altiarchaeota archaeon]|nr:tRNA pseudouridine(13) synthase TruD [Candidatus Altiarchaeota archaeon]
MGQLKPPEVELLVGLEVYKSGSPGLGGVIKQAPEDFIVEEVTPEGKVLELDRDESVEDIRGDYVHFTLQKRSWETMRALKEISDRLRVSQRRLSFAGTKDKRALTTQRASVYGVSIEDLRKVEIKDVVIHSFRYADEAVGLGELWGNRFSVAIRDIDLSEGEIAERINAINRELSGGFPNYFGVQRFGENRPVTHLVGLEIIRGNLEGAVMIYLTKTFGWEDDVEKAFRQSLSETNDFKEALKNVPKKLGYEAALLNHLVQKPGDYAGALRSLPKNLSMMFVHAYQSYVFNKALSECLKRGLSVEKLPLAGTETGVDEITARMMDEDSVKPEYFRIREMPELSSRGEYRDCFKQAYDFTVLETGVDELNEGKNKLVIRFRLEKGNYATTVLREVMKKE